jgi:hypothetical protein
MDDVFNDDEDDPDEGDETSQGDLGTWLGT